MSKIDSLVSIIIPVYNVENYLDACLDSVVRQSYKNLEIILIDDGSPDKSGKICDRWAKKDSRIQVIHKKNEGLNYARKSGWEMSRGEYITFLDSDDLFHKNNIANTLRLLKAEKLDMVAYSYVEFKDGDNLNSLVNKSLSNEYFIKSGLEQVFRFLISGGYENIYSMTAWGKLYKRSLISSVDWSKSNMKAYEDNFFTPQIYEKVEKFAILKQPLYLYRRNESESVLSKTLSGNIYNGKPIGYLEYLDLMRKYWKSFLDKHSLNLSDELEDLWYQSAVFRLNNLIGENKLTEENNPQYIAEIIEKMQKRMLQEIASKDSVISSQSNLIKKLERSLEDVNQKMSELQTMRGSIRNVIHTAIEKSINKSKGRD